MRGDKLPENEKEMLKMEVFVTTGKECCKHLFGHGVNVLNGPDKYGVWVDDPENLEEPIHLYPHEYETGIPFHFGVTYSIFTDTSGRPVNTFSPFAHLWRENQTGVPVVLTNPHWPFFKVGYPSLVLDYSTNKILFAGHNLIQKEDGTVWRYMNQGDEEIPLDQIWPIK